MAISLQDSNKVWEKARAMMDHLKATPASKLAIKDLKTWLATQKGNPQLQFVPFNATAIIANGGYSPDVDACTVYALWCRNSGTGDGTDSFINLHNATDNNSGGLSANVIQDDNHELLLIYPNGLVFGTELTIAAATAALGTTESAAANAADGFVILGA